MTKTKYLFRFVAILLCLGFTACTSEMVEDVASGEGNLRLSLGNVSAETRSTPSELGAPVASDFNICVTNAAGRTIYNQPYRDVSMTVTTGTYSIVAEKGENPMMAYDAPYYRGEATAVVREGETTQVSIPCKVANALVSAYFGTDETETARFGRFYSEYAVRVARGKYSMDIESRHPERSVYLQAGSTVELSFRGRLVATGEEVSMPIPLPEGVSGTLQAADHLRVELALEEVGYDATVIVKKIEVDSVAVEQSLSYNYLPAPMVYTEHIYNRQGDLVGTDVHFDTSFPGMKWTAQIHQGSASGAVVRTLSGTGALSQAYTESSDWPYLPAGTYVVTYSYQGAQGTTYNFSKTRTFTVPEPTLSLTTFCYTSYTMYEEKDIEAANACDGNTVYTPTARLNVDNSLMKNSNYAPSYTYTLNGNSTTVREMTNSPIWGNITGVPANASPYTFSVTATFAGQAVTGSNQVRVTGLPYSINFSSHSEWSASGSVTWESNYVRMGYYSTGGQSITNSTSVRIPKGTKYCTNYRVNISTGAVGSTCTITVGSQEVFSEMADGGGNLITGAVDHTFSGMTQTFSANRDITSVSCKNTYGAGITCSYIYVLDLLYSE